MSHTARVIMTMMSLRLLLVTAIVAALQTPARADERGDKGPRVGVVVELAVDVDAARADALAAALADALNRELVVDAVGGADVTRSLPDGGLPDECLAQPACVKDVASRIDAEELLFLVLVQAGADVQVDASWVDAATGQVLARPRVVLPSEARAVSVFAEQAQRYLPDAKERDSGGQTIIVTGPAQTTPGTPRSMSTVSWITAGVAVAGLGAGIGLGLSVRSDYKACERDGCPGTELDAIERRALLADLSFAVAAGAAITTAILYWRSGSPAETVQPGVAPTAGGAVVGVSGRW